MTEYNLGNSIDNIRVVENILSKDEHEQLLEYAINADSWQTQPWGVKFIVSTQMPEKISNILNNVFALAHQECTNFYNVKLYSFENNQVPLIKFEEGYSMNEHADTAGDIAGNILERFFKGLGIDFTFVKIVFFCILAIILLVVFYTLYKRFKGQINKTTSAFGKLFTLR